MALSSREISIIIRARDLASREIRQVSSALKGMQAAGFGRFGQALSANATAAQSNAKQLDVLGRRMRAVAGDARGHLTTMQAVSAAQKKLAAESAAIATSVGGGLNTKQTAAANKRLAAINAEQVMLRQNMATAQMAHATDVARLRTLTTRNKLLVAERKAIMANAAAEQARLVTQERHRAISGAMVTGGVIAGIGGAVGLAGLGAMTASAAKFRQEAALTQTQVDGVSTSIQQLETLAQATAKAIPVPIGELQEGLFDIFSSIDVQSREAGILLEGAAKGAIAGQTDLRTSTRATISILNAFNDGLVSNSNVQRALDVQFQTVRKGVITYDELANSIGRAIPAAQQTGQTLETLGGAIAFITRRGLSAEMATTSVARAFELLGHTKVNERLREMGISVTDASGEYRQFNDIITELAGSFEDMTAPERAQALEELFKGAGNRIQARRFIISALENFEEFNKRVDEMHNAAGTMQDAYDIMFDQPISQMQLFKTNLVVLGQEIGEILLPVINHLVRLAQNLLEWWEGLSASTQKSVIWLTAASSAILLVGGALTALAGAIGILKATGGLAILFSPHMAVIAAVITALGVIVTKTIILGQEFASAGEGAQDLANSMGIVLGDLEDFRDIAGEGTESTTAFMEANRATISTLNELSEALQEDFLLMMAFQMQSRGATPQEVAASMQRFADHIDLNIDFGVSLTVERRTIRERASETAQQFGAALLEAANNEVWWADFLGLGNPLGGQLNSLNEGMIELKNSAAELIATSIQSGDIRTGVAIWQEWVEGIEGAGLSATETGIVLRDFNRIVGELVGVDLELADHTMLDVIEAMASNSSILDARSKNILTAFLNLANIDLGDALLFLVGLQDEPAMGPDEVNAMARAAREQAIGWDLLGGSISEVLDLDEAAAEFVSEMTKSMGEFISVQEALEEATTDAGFSLSEFNKALEEQAQALANFDTNVDIISQFNAALGLAVQAIGDADLSKALADAISKGNFAEVERTLSNLPLLFAGMGDETTEAFIAALLGFDTSAFGDEYELLGDAAGQGLIEGLMNKLPGFYAQLYAYARASGDVFNPILRALDKALIASSQSEGFIPGMPFNTGGLIPGAGPDRDSVPLWATPGEYMMRRRAVRQYGPAAMEAINNGDAIIQVGGYNTGGMVMPPVPGIHGFNTFIKDTGEGAMEHLYTQGSEWIKENSAPQLGPGIGWEAMWAAVQHGMAMGQLGGLHLSSSYRPGAVTRGSGRQSYHALGRAIDVAGSGSAMGGLMDWIAQHYLSVTREGIYTPWENRQIYKGRFSNIRNPITRADHYDHVHWAMRNGGIVNSPIAAIIGEAGSEAVMPLDSFGQAVGAVVDVADSVIDLMNELATHQTHLVAAQNMLAAAENDAEREAAQAIIDALEAGIGRLEASISSSMNDVGTIMGAIDAFRTLEQASHNLAQAYQKVADIQQDMESNMREQLELGLKRLQLEEDLKKALQEATRITPQEELDILNAQDTYVSARQEYNRLKDGGGPEVKLTALRARKELEDMKAEINRLIDLSNPENPVARRIFDQEAIDAAKIGVSDANQVLEDSRAQLAIAEASHNEAMAVIQQAEAGIAGAAFEAARLYQIADIVSPHDEVKGLLLQFKALKMQADAASELAKAESDAAETGADLLDAQQNVADATKDAERAQKALRDAQEGSILTGYEMEEMLLQLEIAQKRDTEARIAARVSTSDLRQAELEMILAYEAYTAAQEASRAPTQEVIDIQNELTAVQEDLVVVQQDYVDLENQLIVAAHEVTDAQLAFISAQMGAVQAVIAMNELGPEGLAIWQALAGGVGGFTAELEALLVMLETISNADVAPPQPPIPGTPGTGPINRPGHPVPSLPKLPSVPHQHGKGFTHKHSGGAKPHDHGGPQGRPKPPKNPGSGKPPKGKSLAGMMNDYAGIPSYAGAASSSHNNSWSTVSNSPIQISIKQEFNGPTDKLGVEKANEKMVHKIADEMRYRY